MTKERSREWHIAEAFLLISKANHYLVGFTGLTPTYDELQGAKETLITISNAFGGTNEVAERALDLIEMKISIEEQRKAFKEEFESLKMMGDKLLSKDELLKKWTS